LIVNRSDNCILLVMFEVHRFVADIIGSRVSGKDFQRCSRAWNESMVITSKLENACIDLSNKK